MDYSLKNNYRNELSELIEQSFESFNKVVNRHLNVSSKPINAKDLDSFPLNEWRLIGDNIKARKRRNRFISYLSFDVVMEKGASFAEHFHDDVIESTEVIEGEMLDNSNEPPILYVKGDVAHWHKGIKHTPIALKYTRLHVLFKRSKE